MSKSGSRSWGPNVPLQWALLRWVLLQRVPPLACWLVCLLAAASCLLAPTSVQGAEAQWIWWPEHTAGRVPETACYFRKSLDVAAPLEGQVTIAADDAFELFVNGRQVGEGQFEKDLKQFDISDYLRPGRNLVAVRVSNLRGRTAALAARVMVRQRSGWSSYSTDASWKTALRPLPFWKTALYNDRLWPAAQVHGPLGDTPPWDRPQQVAADERHRSERFTISDEFTVHRVVEAEQTGSLIAMTVNEFGHIIASREDGPLLLIHDTDGDKRPDLTRVYCDQVKNCQGILALNGDVFTTCEGPEGPGLYRLSDSKREGKLDEVRLLLKFRGAAGEHAAHGLVLGPDGLIYVVLGNHVEPELEYDPASPHRDYYEGDLLQPRYEDPAGHAAGRKSPGGVVIRTDVEGRSVELVAGGLRNAYDLAFNREGELFVHDSDMESDLGSTWYRPTQLFHVIPGGEYGWRSGWAKWPAYFVDNLPAIADTGRGSPSGAVVYNHHMFPQKYHNALFTADWSQGRILVARPRRDGGGYKTDTEVFLQGQPLNVTDLEVGPDGSLYFCTGGRGTSGGIYRVTWKGKVPDSVRNLGEGISQVIRQPQLHSAWSRQHVAARKQELGDRWDDLLRNVAVNGTNPAEYRTRALDLMQLFGPPPTSELLVQLAQTPSEEVRAKAAELLGLHGDTQATEVLVDLLADSDRTVRRKACEALARLGQPAPYAAIEPLLKSDDRFEAWAARRLLERLPVDQWRDQTLYGGNDRLLIQGGLALVLVDPSEENTRAVVNRIRQVMLGFISDRDFVDMLRVVQVALHRGQLPQDTLAELRDQMAEEFPAGHPIMNRELARLLVYLQADSILDRYLKYLDSDATDLDKLHLALHLRFLKTGWTPEQRLRVLEFLEQVQSTEAGSNLPHYVANVVRDLVKQLSNDEALAILARGDELPTAAVGALYRLPVKLDEETRQLLADLDERLTGRGGESIDRLQVGIVAVLARSGDEPCQELLRTIWEHQPERRSTVAMGLAQSPNERNWDYLIRSLPVLEGEPAVEVLRQLQTIDRRGEEAEHFRQVILRGLALGEQGADQALGLLNAWTGESRGAEGDSWEQQLAAWQVWFADQYPDHPPAELPQNPQESKWSFQELLEHLEGDSTKTASAERGAAAYAKAQCGKCHRFGDQGESLGPDLTEIRRRFTRREVLESILFPSHVISSQYASKTVVTTNGRMLAGLLLPGGEGEKIVLRPDGTKVTLAEDEIDEILASPVSAMPAGLLDELSLQEVADLFAYLGVLPPREVADRGTPGTTVK